MSATDFPADAPYVSVLVMDDSIILTPIVASEAGRILWETQWSRQLIMSSIESSGNIIVTPQGISTVITGDSDDKYYAAARQEYGRYHGGTMPTGVFYKDLIFAIAHRVSRDIPNAFFREFTR